MNHIQSRKRKNSRITWVAPGDNRRVTLEIVAKLFHALVHPSPLKLDRAMDEFLVATV